MTKVAKRLTSIQTEALARDAVRELVRPVFGEAMLENKTPSALLRGKALIAAIDGLMFKVQVAVVTLADYLERRADEQVREVRVDLQNAPPATVSASGDPAATMLPSNQF